MSPLPRHLLRDEPLARLAAAGDRSAFEVLFARYRSALLRCSRSIVRNDHDAEDVVQSTALKALAGLGRRRDGVPFRPWLFRIAYNEAITVLRGRRARPASELELTVAHTDPGPAQQTLARAELRALIDDLAQLTEGQRTALLLRQFNGASYDEIARVLRTTPIAARRSVSTARGNLAAFAEGRDAGCAGIQLTIAAGDRRTMRSLAVGAHLRSCPVCREHARHPGRGARAAALVPVGVWELLGALRGALAPAGAGLTDGLGAPAAKALALAAAVTAGVGAGVGSLHRHAHHEQLAAAPPASKRAAVTHRRAPVHHAVHHVAASPVPTTHTTPIPATHTVAAPVHATHTTQTAPTRTAHYTFVAHAVSQPADVSHHVVSPRNDAAHGAPSPVGAPPPAPSEGDTASAGYGGAPQADDQPPMGNDAAPVGHDGRSGGMGGSAPDAHMDSSQVGPHNDSPGPSM